MTDPKIRSAAMIVNAKSRRGRRDFAKACKAAEALPFPVDARAVRDPDRLNDVLGELLAAGHDLIVIGGGDGTISGLVDGLVGRDVTVGILPFGTANSFARSLGIPLDIAAAVRLLATGRPRRIDLGMIDGDYFANCAALGISPQIAETVPHGLKAVLGRAGYLGWAAWQFVRFQPFTLIVGEGDDAERLRVVEVRISNGAYHGGTLLVDEAKVDSGEIVVQAVIGKAKRRLVRNWTASVLGLDARHDDTRDFRGTSLRIATEPPLPISIDGEVLAHTPVTAHVAAEVIRVIAPA